MANKVLTPRVILREVYALMHQTSNFIMRMNRQYDDRFAQTGAKIGQVLDVRLPSSARCRCRSRASTASTSTSARKS